MKGSKLPPEFLQKVKDAVNLIDVVGEHVVLRKSGSNYTGLCPFHNERSPSFSVSEQKQLYHCYGCKKGGDLIGFTQDIHALSFQEAVEELAERASLPLPKDFRGGDDGTDPELAQKRAAQREKLATAYKLNRFAAKYYRDQVAKQKHIADYFKKRGIDETLAQNFYLGAAPASWDGLASFFATAKAPMPLAAELGLIKASSPEKKSSGPGYFDLFRNRAMFPILDLRGKVVGFGGRGGLTLPAGAPDVGGDSPKYLNSSDSMLFQKSKLAYGLFQAQKHIREKDEVIIVEGYFDVLALHAAGFSNAVATCGTSLTPDHLKLFRKFCTKIVVLFDGDRAGVAAMDRAMETGLEEGMILYGARMPEGQDPDEILFNQETGEKLEAGREKMTEILGASQPLLDLRIEDAMKHSLKGAEAKTQSLKRLAHWMSLFTDPVGREVRAESITTALQISRSTFDAAMTAERKSTRGSGKPAGGTGARVGSGSVVVQSGGGSVAGQNPLGEPPLPMDAYEMGGPPPDMGYQGSDSSSGYGGYAPSSGRNSQWRDRKNERNAPRGPARPRPDKSILRARETVLVTGAVKAGPFLSILRDAGQYLPSGQPIASLADHAEIQTVITRILDGITPGVELVEGIEDPRVRAVVSEALMDDSGGDGETSKRFTEAEFRHAIQKSLALSWARFSQGLKQRLREAELSKDAKLHAELMNEYLDVQRRMKELGTFYDEE